MIEKIFKNIKYIGLGFLIVDVLFALLAILYFSLTMSGIMSVGIWFMILCIVVIAINILFATSLLIIKKLRKY